METAAQHPKQAGIGNLLEMALDRTTHDPWPRRPGGIYFAGLFAKQRQSERQRI